MKITAQEEKKYIERGGVKCPKCDSYDVEGKECDFDKGKMYQKVKCYNCNARWTDIYTLTGIYPGEV